VNFATWFRRLVEGEQPRSIYVRRDVVDHDHIRRWFENQGLKVDGGMHCTIAYSRRPILWSMVPPRKDTIVERGHRMGRLGSDGALVMFIDTRPGLGLHGEWLRFMHAGASYDFDSYRPHITICYQPKVKVADIKPYPGIFELGPQIYETIK